MAKVTETVFVGEECWRSLDNEVLGACTECSESETRINDEFGGFETLLFGYVPDKDPERKHELMGGNEVLCQNCFDLACEDAVASGKAIERHDGWYLGVAAKPVAEVAF
jgi:hypothetical protein